MPSDDHIAPSNDLPVSSTTPRRWRKAFFYLYLAITSIVCAWLAISIIAVQFGLTQLPPAKTPQIHPALDNPIELLRCKRQLDSLLADLHNETFRIQLDALKYKTDPEAEWHNWSESWRLRWRATNHYCRFSELGGTGIRLEIDEMDRVHEELSEMQLAYTDVMEQVITRHVTRLRRLRNKLSTIEQTIEERRRKQSPPKDLSRFKEN